MELSSCLLMSENPLFKIVQKFEHVPSTWFFLNRSPSEKDFQLKFGESKWMFSTGRLPGRLVAVEGSPATARRLQGVDKPQPLQHPVLQSQQSVRIETNRLKTPRSRSWQFIRYSWIKRSRTWWKILSTDGWSFWWYGTLLSWRYFGN